MDTRIDKPGENNNKKTPTKRMVRYHQNKCDDEKDKGDRKKQTNNTKIKWRNQLVSNND